MSSFCNKQDNYREESLYKNRIYALKQQIIKYNLMYKRITFVHILQIPCTYGIIRE